ncbi:hypothetical protein EB061_03900 [bacterium]|nr:hypothetical protein [bacterium]
MARQKKHGALSLVNSFSLFTLILLVIPANAAPAQKERILSPKDLRKQIEADQLERSRELDRQVRADSPLSGKDRELLQNSKRSAPEDVKREDELIAEEIKSIEKKRQIEAPKVRPANAPKPKKPAAGVGVAETKGIPGKSKPIPNAPETPPAEASPAPDAKAVSGEALPEIVYPGK